MGYDVRVEIDKSRTGGVFTNYDIISGFVKLTTTSSLALSYISVKLEGVAHTQLTIPLNEKKDKFRQDTHKILYDSVVVFPPENIRNVSQSKDFTLLPGTYTYDFQFRIPLNSSCVKMGGITNKVQFNKKNFDFVINNGNFGRKYVTKQAQRYASSLNNTNGKQDSRNMGPQSYHVESQLPPSLENMGGMASVKYFIKVTCKRSSLLKVNLRSFDSFTFLPLDLDPNYVPYREGQNYQEYRERFFRKDLIFRDRSPKVRGAPNKAKYLPQIPVNSTKKGSILNMFIGGGSRPPTSSPKKSPSTGPEFKSVDVPFSFEMRMPHPTYLSPTQRPTFKLYLVSNIDPSKYSLAQYGKPDQSNGLGIIYIQSLRFELKSTTYISVLDNDGGTTEIHQSKVEEIIPICNNTYLNLQFDLMNCKRQKSSSATSSTYVDGNAFELEIPKKYYENFQLPGNLAPSFQTCNISRSYNFTVVAGFTSDFQENVVSSNAVKYVDITCPDIQVLSGLKLTSHLHSNASGTSIEKSTDTRKVSRSNSNTNSFSSDRKPSLPNRPSQCPSPKNGTSSPGVGEDSSRLPTYDDVVRESSYQDDSEHQRARYRYNS